MNEIRDSLNASLWDQLNIDAGSSNNDKTIRDRARSVLRTNADGSIADNGRGMKFDLDKITGRKVNGRSNARYQDLEKSFAEASRRGLDGLIEEAGDIKAKADARNRTSSQRAFGHKIGSQEWKDVQPRAGGGQSNVYSFRNFESFQAAGMTDHLGRAAAFAKGVAVKDDLLNSVGLMTKHQKNILRSKNIPLRSKLFTGAPAVLGGAMALSAASEHLFGNKESTITDNAGTAVLGAALSTAVGAQAFRVTKELTHAATSPLKKVIPIGVGQQGSKMGKAMMARGAVKMGIGSIAGGAAFLAASTIFDGAFGLLKESANKDNSVMRLKRKIFAGDTMGDATTNTNALLTDRQRAISKLSKSSLNDRAYIMGNEAMILKGIYR